VIARELKLKRNSKLDREVQKSLWHLTGVYNWAIKTIELRKNAGLGYSAFDLINLVSGHAQKSGVSSQAISGAIFQAFNAWERCWKKLGKRPRLKGKRNKLNSFQFPGDCKIDIGCSKIKLPKLGWIRFQKFTKGLPDGKIAATVRLVKKASGLYAVVIFKEAEHKQVVLASNTQVGIDTGFKDLLILSNGEKIDRPIELAKSASQLAKVQRGLGKRKTGRLQEKIARQRKDRNHKISHQLVRDHKKIYITNDNLKGMAHRFGKSVAASGISQLRQFILYKGSSCGRVVRLIESKNTTKTCSDCEALTGPTGLSMLNVRHWVCASCGASHQRDVNAALNILKAGQRYCLENLASKAKVRLTKLKKTKHLAA
jgi:putative transposase